jgi:hypothetical protein
MSYRWRVARCLALPAIVASCALLPSAAEGSVSVPAAADQTLATSGSTVQTTVSGAIQPVGEAASKAVQTALPGSGGASRPDGNGDRHPVADTVAPIAGAATAPVAAAQAAALPPKHLDERDRRRTSHIAATSSGERMSSGRIAHSHGLDAAADTPSSERFAPARHAVATPTEMPAAAPSAAARPGGAQDAAPPASAPGAAASGGSGGFFFGGGFALLVACLLVAGPRLRRQLRELPAVCRPAAFLWVLERPG